MWCGSARSFRTRGVDGCALGMTARFYFGGYERQGELMGALHKLRSLTWARVVSPCTRQAAWRRCA